MKYPLDIHTHRSSALPLKSIVNIRFPESFCFEPGCYYSVGIHPWDVCLFKDASPDWVLFEELAAHPQVLAIGECGIDKLVHRDYLSLQETLFSTQVRMAHRLQKPLLIHNVRGTDIVQRMLRSGASTQPWVLHGFRGNASLAAQWVGLGAYLSFGAHYNEEALCETPMNRLLVETDDSTLGIEEIYCRVALSRQMSLDALMARVQQNIQDVFFNRQEL